DLAHAHGLVVPKHGAVVVDAHRDLVRLLGRLGREARLRQVDLHLVGQLRCVDHEDDQQHQHHVDQRRDVDFRHRRAATASAAYAHAHVAILLAGASGRGAGGRPVASTFRRGDEPDAHDTGVLDQLQGFPDGLVAQIGVGAYLHFRLGRLPRRPLQFGLELAAGADLAVPPDGAVTLDRQIDDGGTYRLLNREFGLRQVDLDDVLHQRRGDHEDDQQHQHHVDERRDVDGGHRGVVAVAAAYAHAHGSFSGLLRLLAGTDAGAGGEVVVQVVRELVELRQDDAVGTHEEVVGQQGRDGAEQTNGGHDQGFTHRTGDGADVGLAAGADGDQGAVDAPHGTQQADERRRGTDGGQQGQT